MAGRSARGVAFTGLIVAYFGAVSVRAREPLPNETREYLNALNARELFQLLEVQYRGLLETSDLEVSERSRLTLEYAGLLSDRAARTTDAAAREQAWRQADEAVTKFLAGATGSGQAELARFRWAGQVIGRAQRLNDLALTMPEDQSLKAAALAWARQAIQILTETERSLDTEFARRDPKSRPGPDDLKWSQLVGLGGATRFRQGEAFLVLAQSTADEREKSEALARAKTLLAGAARADPPSAATVEARLALAEVYRLSGSPGDAIRLLEQPVEPALSKALARRVQLGLARLYADSEQVDKALALLEVPPNERAEGAQWPFLTFECLLRQAAKLQAFAPDEARRKRVAALALLDKVASAYGEYWNRRGEIVIASLVTPEQAANDLPLLARLASALRRAGRIQEAIAAYDRALALALPSSDPNQAAELTFESGLTLYKAGQFAKAAERMTQVAEKYAAHPLAPRALVFAAHSLARDPMRALDAEVTRKYRDVLEEHLKRFATDLATAPEVHWMLGELMERQREWQKAIEHYQQIPTSDRRFPDSIEALAGILHDRLIKKLDQDDPETLRQLQRAIEFLQDLSEHPPRALTESEQGRVALALARYVLGRLLSLEVVGRTDEAIALLRDQVVGDKALKPGPKNRGRQLLLELYLQRGDATNAVAWATTGFDGQEGALASILARLDPEASGLSPVQRDARVRVIEAVAPRLMEHSSGMEDGQRKHLRLLQARALEAKGEHAAALRLFRALRAESPRDREVAFRLAQSLYRNAQYEESLKAWDQLRRGAPRGGADWLLAVYHIVCCHEQLGRRDEAQALLTTTLQLFPNLPTDDLEAKFAEVQSRLGPPAIRTPAASR